jgi:hypothetical protein
MFFCVLTCKIWNWHSLFLIVFSCISQPFERLNNENRRVQMSKCLGKYRMDTGFGRRLVLQMLYCGRSKCWKSFHDPATLPSLDAFCHHNSTKLHNCHRWTTSHTVWLPFTHQNHSRIAAGMTSAVTIGWQSRPSGQWQLCKCVCQIVGTSYRRMVLQSHSNGVVCHHSSQQSQLSTQVGMMQVSRAFKWFQAPTSSVDHRDWLLWAEQSRGFAGQWTKHHEQTSRHECYTARVTSVMRSICMLKQK